MRQRHRRFPFRLTLGMAAAAGLVLTAAPAQATGEIVNANAPGTLADQYIVVLDGAPSAAGEAQVRFYAQDLAGRYGGSLGHVYSAALRGFSVRMPEQQARRLAAEPAVKYVQQSGMVRAAGTQQNPPSWGLDRVDQPDLPLDDAYTYPNEGTGVTAYIADSGIRGTHKTFEGRAEDGYDFVDDDATTQDCNGHGTHVAGTVGGEDHGVAKDVSLVAVRVLGCDGTAPDSVALAGLDWIAKNAAKPAVVNMSLTFDTVDEAQEEAVRNVVGAGITVVVAAGNSGADACQASPARVPEVITLGNSDERDRRSLSSNHGRCLDLFAPGTNITSASHSSDDGSATMTGTSMASPHAAGAAALYLSTHAQAAPQEVQEALTGNAVQGKIGDPGAGSPNLLLNVGKLG
ncbi:S8 family peptidase [Saccharopolyspora taberi]|uniref:S8 family peptidase n=1 Tax=Saccharopolyspora taberi TaxID=60895 RepID=A0ABN3V4M6_9PSEU